MNWKRPLKLPSLAAVSLLFLVAVTAAKGQAQQRQVTTELKPKLKPGISTEIPMVRPSRLTDALAASKATWWTLDQTRIDHLYRTVAQPPQLTNLQRVPGL